MAVEEGHYTYNHTFAQLPSVHSESCKHAAQVHTDDELHFLLMAMILYQTQCSQVDLQNY